MTKKCGQKKKDVPKSGPESPKNLESNAQAYFRNAESFREKRQQKSMRECYEKALELKPSST